MQFITELIAVLGQELSPTKLTHFACIIDSMIAISSPVTMRSLTRMSPLSYRTIQRFYALKEVNWLLIRLLLFKAFVYKQGQIYLLAADETVEGKAGKATYGISYFYSSIAQQAIRSVSFLAISLIDVSQRSSYVLACQQIIAPPKPSPLAATDAKASKPTGAKGRPKGSKNKPKTEPESVSYQTLKALISLLMNELKILLPALQCFHLVLDGFYGHQAYVLLAIEHHLKIISKFKINACLFLPYQGEQSGRGRPKTKGNKLQIDQLDARYLVLTQSDESRPVLTHIYQVQAYTPKIKGQLLNVVILVHIHRKTQKRSHTILFTNDMNLSALAVIDYYSLRFQIEFDFRDAKQFYGLSDFKNYHQTQVTNAVNIAFTMTVVGKLLLAKYKVKVGCPTMGHLDLKSIFRVSKYAQLFFKSDSLGADEFLNSPEFLNLARLEAIHI